MEKEKLDELVGSSRSVTRGKARKCGEDRYAVELGFVSESAFLAEKKRDNTVFAWKMRGRKVF